MRVKCTQYGSLDKWHSKMKWEWFCQVGRAGNNFPSGPKTMSIQDRRLPLPESTPLQSSWGGGVYCLSYFYSKCALKLYAPIINASKLY